MMKTSQKVIEKVTIIILILSSCRCFYLLPLPQVFLNLPSNVLFCAVVTILSFVVIGVLCKKYYWGKFGHEIIWLYCILAMNLFFVIYKYGYNYKTIFMTFMPFILFLGYFPIIEYLYTNKYGIDSFIRIILNISSILAVVLLVQSFIFHSSSVIFLKIAVPDPEAFSGRFYDVSEGIIRISVIISSWLLIKEKFKFSNLINLLLCLLSIVFVDQSRIYLAAVLISIIFMVILNSKKSPSIFKIFIYLCLIVISVFIIYNLYSSIINTLADARNGSNYARKEAIEYYLANIKSFWLTGYGLVVPDKYNIFYTFIKGPIGIYNYSDIGIFGIFASLGIFAVVWYIWVILKGIYLTHKINNKYRILCWGLLMEMIVSIVTMTYFDASRIFSFLLVLAILSYATTVKSELR